MNQDKIWQHFQVQAVDSFDAAKPRLQFLAKMAKKINPIRSVLNIGVGAGQFEKQACLLGLEVYALDPSDDAIEKIAEEFDLRERAKVGYVQTTPFASNSMGVVNISEVLEHLTENESTLALQEIQRVLVKGGYIIGTVPAREKLQDNEVVCPECGKVFHRWGHQRSFTPEVLTAELARYFSKVKCVERHFMNWRIQNQMSKGKLFLKNICWRVGIRTADESILFIGKKQ